jgi:RimJ/RimL family protein N-acetyltransferase
METTRLRLRLVEERDLPDLMAVNGDERVTRYLPYETWRTLDDAAAWFARMSQLGAGGASLQFAIMEKASARVIGTSLLFRYDEANARAELGYVLGRAHWGKGLMREAIEALISYAFGLCELRRLEAEVQPDNLASNRLLQALGFTHEGLLRERWLTKGQATDSNIYGLLAPDWAARKKAQPAPG